MSDLISRADVIEALEALKQRGAEDSASFGNGALEKAIWAVEKLPVVRPKRRKPFREFD
jgi:glutamate synthase domain-containing protein 1